MCSTDPTSSNIASVFCLSKCVFILTLADGLDCAHVEKNIRSFKGFGSRNKESVAQLFVSLISKVTGNSGLVLQLLSTESLWEHGLCASNLEASWISKTWKKGVGNLSVEDFLDRSQNFARAVGKVQMQKICKCLRDCSLNLLDFMRGNINTSKLKTLLFGHLSPDALVSKLHLRHVKGKRKLKLSPKSRCLFQKRANRGSHHVEPYSHSNMRNATGLPIPTTAKIMPCILYRHHTQSSNQTLQIPWLRIIPSGFGYGLSVPLPVDPHCGKGILGPPPGNLSSLDNGIRQLQQRPLFPMPNQ
ncbi:hypothetical protein PR202_gb23404 [Eleusine coracana subsp. coracana]|uniref:Uncharacterized protein n=1 Tax=Eleusine coracana subsp. coracana TaxID=191504 RepID=A0AAV5FIT9_ELECO|nr:hypothetical protein PR202_gb23404 [Eleusine coracana subsp. coracana]